MTRQYAFSPRVDWRPTPLAARLLRLQSQAPLNYSEAFCLPKYASPTCLERKNAAEKSFVAELCCVAAGLARVSRRAAQAGKRGPCRHHRQYAGRADELLREL